jgi:hypothetical protein
MHLYDISSILGLIAVAMCWALAVVLFRAGTPGSVGRKLAVLLVFEGIALVTNVVFIYLLERGWNQDDPALALGQIIHTLSDCAMLALYPAFLAAALRTRLTRLFATRALRVPVLCLSMVLFLSVQFTEKLGQMLLFATLSILFSYAMVASIHAWLTAKPGINRDRARSFAFAFSFRDVCWGFVFGISIYDVWLGSYLTDQQFAWVDLIYRLGTLIYVPIVAYGILRTQLFDIDLRLRRTIKQSTLAAIIVATMFVISEGTEQLLTTGLGNVESFLVAAIVVLVLTPVQRFAERVAAAAMPNTQNTPGYVATRKKQVYEAAVSEALQEGGISDKERSLLVRLRDSLGVSEADANAIESELLASAGS